MLLSGAGGFGYQNEDYIASNALLKDLIVQDWPLIDYLDGIPTRIVYYFGYYLPSALIGKLFGWTWANLFSLIWTMLGVALSFIWFVELSLVRIRGNATRLLILAIIFCFAGGLDFFGYYVLRSHPFDITSHIERWAGYFQYSSHSTLIYWVPQHTIAAWLIVGLTTNILYRPGFVKYLGMAIAAVSLWSPFGIIGVTPFLLLAIVFLLQEENRKYLFSHASMFFNLSAIWIGGIILLFLSANRFTFPMGSLWNLVGDSSDFLKNLLAFWFLEFGFLGFLVVLMILLTFESKFFRIRKHDRLILWMRGGLQAIHDRFEIDLNQLVLLTICLVVLLVLPNFKIGIANDLVMRGSIPAIFVFWAIISKITILGYSKLTKRQRAIYFVLIVVLVVSFFPAINEVARSISRYRLGPPTFSTVTSTGEANDPDTVEQRIGDDSALFYKWIGK